MLLDEGDEGRDAVAGAALGGRTAGSLRGERGPGDVDVGPGDALADELLEEETGGEPMFTAQTLRQIIQFYGGTVQGALAKYLEESLAMFAKQQEQWQDMVSTTPMKTFADMAEQNMKMWSDMQKSFFNPSGYGADNKDKDDK